MTIKAWYKDETRPNPTLALDRNYETNVVTVTVSEGGLSQAGLVIPLVEFRQLVRAIGLDTP